MTEDERSGVIISPRLKTKRLRSKSMNDIDFILGHFDSDEVNQYSSYENPKDKAPGKTTGFRLGIALEDIGELIGAIEFHAYSKRDFRAEIGYDLARVHPSSTYVWVNLPTSGERT